LRAYVAAGRPIRLEPFGSFADYDLIRGALVWLGLADPATSRERLAAADPYKAELGEILSLWRQTFGDRQMTVADLQKGLNMHTDSMAERLMELLEQKGRKKWDAAAVGKYFKRHRDRMVDGLILRSVMRSKLNVWWV